MDKGNSVLGLIALMHSNSVKKTVDKELKKLNMHADKKIDNIKERNNTIYEDCYISGKN